MNEEQRKFFEGLYKRLVDIDEYIVNDNSISESDECFDFACDVCQQLNDIMYWIDGYIHGQIADPKDLEESFTDGIVEYDDDLKFY